MREEQFIIKINEYKVGTSFYLNSRSYTYKFGNHLYE